MSDQLLIPLVSVIIPTFNRAHMIGDALNSALEQTYSNIEVIIIDDGSTDGTQDYIATIIDPRLRYVKQENAGAYAARNHGITISRGNYIAFLDSDDVYEKTCIEAKVAVAITDETCVLVGGGCSYFNEHTKNCINDTPARASTTYEDLCIFTAFPGGSCNIFAKRDAVMAAGLFNTSLSESEDRDFLRRLAKQGSIKSCNFNTVSIRLHSEARPNRYREKEYVDREWVSAQIPEKALREKSRAWNAMVMANTYWEENKKIKAFEWWIRSFLIYPGNIHPERSRITPILKDCLSNIFYPNNSSR